MNIRGAGEQRHGVLQIEPSLPPAEQIVSDEDLFLRYREQGDRAAFEELVHRYERELFSYLYRYLGDRQTAEDIFQASFLQLHRKHHLFEEGRRLRPWLYRIATHLAIDTQRKFGRHRPVSLDVERISDGPHGGSLLDLLESAVPAPSTRLEDQERDAEIQRAVARLPDNLRLPVILAFFQGLKYREIAEVLDVPEGTVKWQVHAAIKRLHESLRQLQPA